MNGDTIGHPMEEPLNTLVYKRTHIGDPDESGTFGIDDCMGRVRLLPFAAVIGVGGKSPWPKHKDIALKINWTGIGPTYKPAPSHYKAPFVTFECFVLLEKAGPQLEKCAPNLFRHFFKDDKHFVMSQKLLCEMQEEVQAILRWAKAHHSRKHASHVVRPEGHLTVPLLPCEETNSTKRKC
jgi:hypothetical protein